MVDVRAKTPHNNWWQKVCAECGAPISNKNKTGYCTHHTPRPHEKRKIGENKNGRKKMRSLR